MIESLSQIIQPDVTTCPLVNPAYQHRPRLVRLHNIRDCAINSLKYLGQLPSFTRNYPLRLANKVPRGSGKNPATLRHLAVGQPGRRHWFRATALESMRRCDGVILERSWSDTSDPRSVNSKRPLPGT